jgi:hypothetical protein
MKTQRLKYRGYNITHCFVWKRNIVSHIKENHRLMVFENWMLGCRGHVRQQARQWQKTADDCIIKRTRVDVLTQQYKLLKLRMNVRNVYKILVGKQEEK